MKREAKLGVEQVQVFAHKYTEGRLLESPSSDVLSALKH